MNDAARKINNIAPPPAVSLREALLYWSKLGFISFGGPAGQIAIWE
jgi:chromate transporter